jgi:hypothetical protein
MFLPVLLRSARRRSVAAGNHAVLKLWVLGAAWRWSDVCLVLAGTAAQLCAGIAHWEPGSPSWPGLVSFSVLVAPPAAMIPGAQDLPLRLVDRRRGDELASGVLRIEVAPAFTVEPRTDPPALLLTNRTSRTWRSNADWLSLENDIGPQLRMREEVVVPGERATFEVPPDLRGVPLRLISARIARQTPAVQLT